MAVLLNLETGQSFRVRARSLVGRASRSDIRLSGMRASSHQASIQWDGVCWMLKDLSRNGTVVNGLVLSNGRACRMEPGDDIVFGDPGERWRWLDGKPPCPTAICRDRGLHIEGTDGVLLLPDDATPRASVCARDGHWELDINGGSCRVQDGEVVRVSDLSFELELPCIDPAAIATHSYRHQLSILGARIHFQVSQDEEFVSVSFTTGSTTTALRPRAFHYLLLILARARLEDTAAGVSEAEAGWLYADEVARRRCVSVEDTNVDICRARKQIAQSCQFVDAVHIIERRSGTGHLRLGVAAISIERNDARSAPAPVP